MILTHISLLFAFTLTLVSTAPHRNHHIISFEDKCTPGWERCDGAGFDTYVPGGEWEY